LFEKKHPAWKICRYSILGLQYLKWQKNCQSQWLLSATTNKCYVCSYNSQPPQNCTTISDLLHNRLKAIQYKKACFSLPFLTICIFSEDRMRSSSEPVKIPDIRAFSLKLFSDTNLKTKILEMSGKFLSYGNLSLLCKLL